MNLNNTALVLVDLQNDFLHPQGAYGRAGVTAAAISALPQRLKPVVDVIRKRNGWILSTHFTLVPGKRGEPFIAGHLHKLRPFLTKGDFAPGRFGHALVAELAPADLMIEKVAYSAFYMSRLEWLLRRVEIETLIFAGIVTNGGVTSTVRDAHVRDFHSIVLSDGCAAFDMTMHETSLAALKGIAEIMSCDELLNVLSD